MDVITCFFQGFKVYNQQVVEDNRLASRVRSYLLSFIKIDLEINNQSICANKSTRLYLFCNTIKPSSSMQDRYLKLMSTHNVQYLPTVAYDTAGKTFAHLYHNVLLDPSTFKEEVNLYLSRKESFSGSVVTVNKITD